MKKMFASCALFFCALILHAHTQGDDPRQEFTWQINRQFATTANGMTVLYNAHGDIAIQTSPNAREVKVDVTIIVKAKSKQEADRIFDAIQVNFTHTPGYVKAQTVLQKNFPGSVGCKEFRVNYKINMPADNQLELSNRYGNTHIAGGLNGKLNAEVKYGDLTLEHPVNETQFLLGYGKLKAAQIGFAQGQLNYAQFDANQTSELRPESKYSKIKVDHSDNVVLTSRYDDLNFGAINPYAYRPNTAQRPSAKRKAPISRQSIQTLTSSRCAIDWTLTYLTESSTSYLWTAISKRPASIPVTPTW